MTSPRTPRGRPSSTRPPSPPSADRLTVSTDGLAVIDKPEGWTSHDVVARMRRILGTRKVGHAGTLDPMATGVLVLGVGRGTKLLTYLVGTDKTYLATIRLGASTVTDDREGEVLTRTEAGGLDEQAVRGAVRGLTGELDQVPSAVSAIKVDGRRAYARVRAGEQVALPARRVTISRFEVLNVRRDRADGLGVVDLDVVVDCSSGTYIRALARDLGVALGVGGHLTALRRTRVGPFDLAEARTLDQLAGDAEITTLEAAARSVFPVRELTQDEARRLAHGQRLVRTASGDDAAPRAAFAPDGTLVAIVSEAGSDCRPLLVIPG
ncbi:MAG: tRNA pseudouridine(55) synthase TruB [Kineosporiaceae bacterium]|nr:tRNA pseudouridine(55) synthase TruB [Kineosporiaceae bacterium]